MQVGTRHQVTVDQCQTTALGAANLINRGSGHEQTTPKQKQVKANTNVETSLYD